MAKPTFHVAVRSNARDLMKQFGDIARRQVPFATSRALNLLAAENRDAERDRFGQVFRSRKKSFAKRIQMNASSKRRKPIQAAVGHRDDFMVDHEVGKVRRRQKGGGRQAVPTRLVTRTATGKVHRSQMPGRLISSKAGRLSRPGKGDAMVLRSAKGLRRKDRRRNLSGGGVYWLLLRKVRIKPRWRFRATVERRVRKNYDRVFVRELEQAIRSRRVRSGSFTSEQGRAAFLAAGQRMAAGKPMRGG